MASEPYSWDRREFRKYRWRERSYPRQHHNHQFNYNNNNLPPRWTPDIHHRPLPCHESRHIIHDEFGHGLMPFRPNEKILEDENCRTSGSGRYGRNSREYHGSSLQKDYKAHASAIVSQPNGAGNLNCTSGQRSVDVMPSHNFSTPSSDSINSRDHSLSKYQHESNNAVGSLGSSGNKLERENYLNSVNWKPLKWTRSESLSVKNSGLSHSSSSKSLEPDSSDVKTDLLQTNVISVLSPPRAATSASAVGTSNAAAEESNSRKKPRLGWGQGLAKFENKKVDSSDESEKKGATICGSHLETLRSHASNLTGKRPERVMVSECALPVTPSVFCSSSPRLQENHVFKTVSTDHDSAYICKSPSETQNSSDVSFSLEELDMTTISNLNSSIEELLQSDDPAIDSSFLSSTAMNKLLLLKNNISKAVETAETEIDLLENELKTILSELRSNNNYLYASSSVRVVHLSKPYEDHSAASNADLKFAGLHVVVDSDIPSKDDHLVVKDLDVDNSVSATTKFVGISLSKDVSPPKMPSEIVDPDLNMSDLEIERGMDYLIGEKPIISSCSDGIGSQLIGCNSISSDADSLNFCLEEFSHDIILASNRYSEQIASEATQKLLPSNGFHYDFLSVVEACCAQHGLVKERFFRWMYYSKLKEKILTLKFRMFWHIWNEDMHILSLKKLRGKTRKKFGLSLRNEYSSCQKQCPSIRPRCSSTGLSLVTTSELMRCASRFLDEPQLKPLRSTLKMPSMIINWQERMTPSFISYNGLVEDPLAVEKERSINLWSPEEEEVFIDKLALFGKDFKKIASLLDGKTTADCVEFYYKNHKSDTFKRAKKKPEFSKQSNMTYLRTSANRWNLEADAASLKILGAASAVAAKIDDYMEIQPKYTSNSFLESGSGKMESGGDILVDRSSSLCLYNNEIETVAADVLAGICSSLSSEATSSCIIGSLDPGEGYHSRKYQRVGSSNRRPLTLEVTQNVVETFSDDSCGKIDPTDWTDEEKALFIQAVSSYGKDFTMIARSVKTKTRDQCKIFFSKARKCLGFDKSCPRPENLIKDDINRYRSDACLLDTGSVICNGKSGLRVDEDIASEDLKLGYDPMKVSIAYVKPDLSGAQEIVVGDMDSMYTLTSKNLLPDDHGREDNFDGNDGSRNSGEVVSNLDVAHGDGQAKVENLPNFVETADKTELASDGSHGNGSSAKVIPDLGVADDVEQVNCKSLPKVTETGTRSRQLNDTCIVVPEAKPDVEGCICKSNFTTNDLETKNTTMRCSLHDEHFIHQVLESAVEVKQLVLQQHSSALADQGSTISTIQHGKQVYVDASVVVPERTRDVQCDKIDEQHLPRKTLMEQMQSTCKVEQYPHPVAISTIKDMSTDISCKTLVPEGTNVARYLGRDFHLQSCRSRKAVSSDAELASAPHQRGPPEPSSGSQPYINKLSTNVDVKLFGQILSKTSQHKPNLSARLSDGCGSQHHSSDRESSIMKCSSSQQEADGLFAQIKHVHNNIVGLDNLRLRKIGYRDQKIIPKGSSALPDSTILLARYPTAFSNYVPPQSKMELPTLNGVAKSVGCSLNGVPTFSNKDVGVSNGSADLHMYRNQDMQSFSLDMRNKHDHLLAQMQRRNGFDVVLVGVSDPVAAFRMQYSKSEQQQFSGGHLAAANIVREDDRWRGKGNIGR